MNLLSLEKKNLLNYSIYLYKNSLKRNLHVGKDKKIRKNVQNIEKKKFILKSLIKNLNFSNLIRFNAINNLNKIDKRSSKVFISNRCINTINKKKFNKLTNYSRIIFLKLARHKSIYGLNKSSW